MSQGEGWMDGELLTTPSHHDRAAVTPRTQHTGDALSLSSKGHVPVAERQ